MSALLDAIRSEDPAYVARLLEESPGLKARLDEPLPDGAFGATALIAAVNRGNRGVIDVLLRAGASVNQKSHWWAGPFHVLDSAADTPGLPAFLIERGAVPEIHHLVRLGMIADVRRALDADPALVHARGGDGQLPLHFAQTIEMADLLLSRGAEIDAIDVDHESTAAQWMIRDRHDIARHLVARGARADILMASALGDAPRVTRIVDADPDAIRTTVSEEYFPKKDPRAGGTIYIWTLGSAKSAHAIAREFGHDAVFRLLMDRSPADLQLAVACELGDERLARELIARHPGAATSLPPAQQRKIADAARRNNTAGVRLLLEAGWPPDARGQHNATPLHWAGFHGNPEMARDLVARGATLNARGDEFDGTPVQWALHGSLHGEQCRTGDYAGVIELLLGAGADEPSITDESALPPAVIDALHRAGRRR